jgi:hypothetical protein
VVDGDLRRTAAMVSGASRFMEGDSFGGRRSPLAGSSQECAVTSVH